MAGHLVDTKLIFNPIQIQQKIEIQQNFIAEKCQQYIEQNTI